jgi:hypothetical protein
VAIEDHRPAGGRALVECEDIAHKTR